MTILHIDVKYHSFISSPRTTAWLYSPIIGIMLLALSTNEYQIFYQIHFMSGQELIDISHGVLSGHPPWKAFQARFLGPLAFAGFESAVAWLQTTSPQIYVAFERVFSQPDTRDLVSLDAFIGALLVVKNFTCFSLLRRYTGSLVRASAGCILGSILFVMLSNHWLYMWDMFEIIIFSFLAFMMFQGSEEGIGFILLYALSLTNRESAAFFGVWLLCHASARRLVGGEILWREVGAGAVLVAIAILYVTVLRHYFLIESTLGHETSIAWMSGSVATASGTTLHAAMGNHLLILENSITFVKNLVSTHFYVDAYILALVLHATLLVQAGLRKQNARLVAIGVFNLILLASIASFALINETRLFLICIPFVIFSVATFSGEILAFLARVDRRQTLAAHPEVS